VHLLADWLSSALAALPTGCVAAVPAAAAQEGATLASTALAVYGAAFDELRGALAVESRDRAELLHALWSHFFSLLELRSGFVYEGALREAQAAAAALDEARAAAVADCQHGAEAMEALRKEHAKELALKDAQTKNIAQVRLNGGAAQLQVAVARWQ
jgi:hypothetical protein